MFKDTKNTRVGPEQTTGSIGKKLRSSASGSRDDIYLRFRKCLKRFARKKVAIKHAKFTTKTCVNARQKRCGVGDDGTNASDWRGRGVAAGGGFRFWSLSRSLERATIADATDADDVSIAVVSLMCAPQYHRLDFILSVKSNLWQYAGTHRSPSSFNYGNIVRKTEFMFDLIFKQRNF